MASMLLERAVAAFNQRQYDEAARLTAAGLNTAQGREEAFWLGLHEACEGYAHLMQDRLSEAEANLVAAMQKLRNFGFQYQNFDITGALASFRLAVAEIRAVRSERKQIFDLSLLPQLRLAAKADD
jgi:predicted metal-dependent hydrolase